eukprot:TRINITY_DN9794_c0_g1_i5.p3 TRINITY_DN9794_c0_g1~~TRINITY_DN9794_c0_g1_i5.p3  ORF type:complete len:164 (+),score=16.65 TRINITY_DN9794_c0_g1_i5:101-592(+)
MPPIFAPGEGTQQKRHIAFSTTKKELFSLSNGLKQLQRRLRANWKISAVKDQLVAEKLEDVSVLVFMGPRQKFTAAEFDVLRGFLDGGGSLLMLLGDGGETRLDTNVNFLLEEYGIMVNNGENILSYTSTKLIKHLANRFRGKIILLQVSSSKRDACLEWSPK